MMMAKTIDDLILRAPEKAVWQMGDGKGQRANDPADQ
jgi:hypothetical protein